MTDEELKAIEVRAASGIDYVERHHGNWPSDAWAFEAETDRDALVAEVRRLRGLIKEAAPVSDDAEIEGNIHRAGPFYAAHATPATRPWEGATLRVWHKVADMHLYVHRGDDKMGADGATSADDELPALLELLKECKVID